ncbi:hypothetical protein B0H14DRAFT_2554309 [Mycena olivaceomarginata]|nr:hypothetical protein B0H14DRAFT_2554309 [Mycena olivaceomarginata]
MDRGVDEGRQYEGFGMAKKEPCFHGKGEEGNVTRAGRGPWMSNVKPGVDIGESGTKAETEIESKQVRFRVSQVGLSTARVLSSHDKFNRLQTQFDFQAVEAEWTDVASTAAVKAGRTRNRNQNLDRGWWESREGTDAENGCVITDTDRQICRSKSAQDK